VDDPQGAVAHPVGFDEVFFYDGAYVPRGDGVQVEHITYGNTDGFVVFSHDRKMRNPAPQAGPGRKNHAITVKTRT
jgi:hypothetical protein